MVPGNVSILVGIISIEGIANIINRLVHGSELGNQRIGISQNKEKLVLKKQHQIDFDFKSLFSNYTDKWNTNIGIYIYVYEINRSNCRVKSNGYNYCRNGINRYGEISKSIYIQRKRITSLVIKNMATPVSTNHGYQLLRESLK